MHFTKFNIISTLALVILGTGAVLAVNLSSQKQENRSRASTGGSFTVALKPVADASVSSSDASDNKGNSEKLGVEAGSKTKISYFKFDLSAFAGATIQNAVFRFRVGEDPDQSKDTMYVRVVPDTSWNEYGITYNNKPTLSTILGTLSGPNTKTWYTANLLPAAIQPQVGRLFSFAVQAPSGSSDYLEMQSREDPEHAPQLFITYSQGGDTATDYDTRIQPVEQSSLPSVAPVNQGAMSGSDNQLSILDYNILIGCYSDLSPAVSCTPENKIKSDLNKDGHVNQFDYNLFIRMLNHSTGQ